MESQPQEQLNSSRSKISKIQTTQRLKMPAIALERESKIKVFFLTGVGSREGRVRCLVSCEQMRRAWGICDGDPQPLDILDVKCERSVDVQCKRKQAVNLIAITQPLDY